MRFIHPDPSAHLELSVDDVFLLPGRYEHASRLDTDLTPTDIPFGSHPVVSANMNAVTGKRMAETMARLGGLGVLPQDMSVETLERIVRHIKAADPRYDTPLVVGPDATLHDVEGIMRKRSHGMVVVVEAGGPIGIVTPSDLRDRDRYSAVHQFMQKQLVTVGAGTPNRDAFLCMEAARVKAAPVIDGRGQLVGVLTRDDAVRLELLSPSLDSEGRLVVAAAIGISSEAARVATQLVAFGVDVLVLDTAHGHQRRMLDTLRDVRQAVGPEIPLVAGNVCTREGTRDLIEAGADVVKVNVGPGAMCTTRMQTGVGRPTFSAVHACAAEAHRLGRSVWADGGVRHPRDICLYCAAGASRVMVGTAFAGTYESPGDIEVAADGSLYKVNFGMASARAVFERTSGLDAFDRAKKGFFREGVSRSRIHIPQGREGVGHLIIDMITGLQSALTYVGATDLRTFHQEAVVGVQTAGGFYEGLPRGGEAH